MFCLKQNYKILQMHNDAIYLFLARIFVHTKFVVSINTSVET